MKLTKMDKQILSDFGFPNEDFQQIEKATSKKYTTYELDGEFISLEEALQLMDRTEYLSGLGRSAFHWSAARETIDGRTIYFDSSKLFK
jgi:hypothetical protein